MRKRPVCGPLGGVVADRPQPPEGLHVAGRALWDAIHGDVPASYELDARELDCLERACRCADRIADLEAEVQADGVTVTGSRGQKVLHPAVSEIRQTELVRLRLLSAIELVDAEREASTPSQARARRAAMV